MAGVLKRLAKVAAAGLTAFCLLCVFAAFYYNPAPHIPSSTGATDYARAPGAFYAYMTEGYSFGRTDGGGFNNPADMAGHAESPDILFMGSSHIEAMYVPQEENAPYVLQTLLEDKTVYNIAMSAHPLAKCLRNLESALETYRPKGYVIIENMSPILSPEEVDALYEGTQPYLSSYGEDSWLYWAQQPPYVKLMYEQLSNVLAGMESSETPQSPQIDQALYERRLYEVLLSASQTIASYGCTPVILFHPRLYLNADGTAYTRYSQDDLALMQRVCEETGIVLVDMTQPFLDAYAQEHILPHGFTNTEIGTGHLNRHGHRIVAQTLYPIVQ